MSGDTDPAAATDGAMRPDSRRWRLAGPWLALVVLLALSVSLVAARSAPDSSPGARAGRLSRELKCPVCQGLSVAESRDPSSTAIRADVRERIDAGQSDDEIRSAYVRLYGEQVLLAPERGGLGVLVWGLPVAVVVVGAGGIVFALRRARRGSTRAVRARRRVLAVGGLVALAAAAGVTLAMTAGDRTPDRRAGAEPSGPSREQRRDALARAVAAHPDDYATRVAYARFLANDDGSRRLEAIRQYDAAAALDTSQPEPRAYAGWLLGLSAKDATRQDQRAALIDAALERIDGAMEIDADYPDAYVFKGLVLFEVEGDAESAIPWLQRYLQLAPQDDPMREVVVGALARAVEQSPTTTVTSGSQYTPPTTTPPTTPPTT